MILRRMRTTIAAGISQPIRRRYCRRVSAGNLPAIPFRYWRRIPSGARAWYSYHVLKASTRYAWDELRRHPVLGPLCDHDERSWALSPSSLIYLWETLRSKRPCRIVDFGSGTSTLVFARYAAEMAQSGLHAEVISVDHDERFLEGVRTKLSERRLDRYVSLVHAPVREQGLLGRKLEAYELPIFWTGDWPERSVDFCLIDGPPYFIGRAGSLAVVAPQLAEGATILLDDAYRSGEQQIIEEWCSWYRKSLSPPRLLITDSHGVALLRWSSHAVA